MFPTAENNTIRLLISVSYNTQGKNMNSIYEKFSSDTRYCGWTNLKNESYIEQLKSSVFLNLELFVFIF